MRLANNEKGLEKQRVSRKQKKYLIFELHEVTP